MRFAVPLRLAALIILPTLPALLSSCRSGEENLPPVIDLVKPWEHQAVAPGDTLPVLAYIADEEMITTVMVQLVDGQGTPCGPAQETVVNQKEFTLDTYYVIPPDLSFGNSFALLVRAYDVSEFKNRFRELTMLFPPLERKGVLAVTSRSSNIKRVYHLDTLGQVRFMFDVPGDSGASLLWDPKQLLVTAGSVSGDLYTHDLVDTSTSWTISAVPDPPFNFFTGLAADGDLLWVGFEEGFISGYNASGVKIVQTTPSASHVPSVFVRAGELIAGFWDDRLNQGGRIYWHYAVSGAVKQYTPFSADCRAICADVNGSVFIFGNAAGEACIWEESAGIISKLQSYPQHELLTGLNLQAGGFIVALDDGVYLVNGSSGSLTALIPGFSARFLEYDEQAGQVIAASGTSLCIYDTGSGQVATISLPYPVTGIHPWYSR